MTSDGDFAMAAKTYRLAHRIIRTRPLPPTPGAARV
jgi:hypothetical protein